MVTAQQLLTLSRGPASGDAGTYGQFVEQWRAKSAPRQHATARGKDEHEFGWAKTALLDLEVYVQPAQSWWQRCFGRSPAQRLLEQTHRSLLILQQPHWPLQRILFIARAETTDWTALPWLERLAQPHGTAISIIPIVPPWPRFHRKTPYAQPAPEVLLAPNTVSGMMLNDLVQRLRLRQLAVTLSLTAGEPDCRIREEVARYKPDLIVIAAETENRLLRHLYGELVKPLLRWVTCPLLITK